MILSPGWFERSVRNIQMDMDTLPSWLLSDEGIERRAKMSRSERIQALIHCFSRSFTEGSVEKTQFDLDVVETLTKLKDKYR